MTRFGKFVTGPMCTSPNISKFRNLEVKREEIERTLAKESITESAHGLLVVWVWEVGKHLNHRLNQNYKEH